MKKFVLLVAALASVQAAALPDVVTYTARIENNNGPFNGNASVLFELFAADAGGTALWSEFIASLPISDGELVHDLGSAEPLDDALLNRDDLLLEITINGDTLAPRLALRAVPYALRATRASVADRLGSLSESAVTTDAELAAFRVNSAIVTDNTIAGADILDGTIAAADLGNGAVTSAKLSGARLLVIGDEPGCLGALDIDDDPAPPNVYACQSKPCGIVSGTVRFWNCAATTCVDTAPTTCVDTSATALGALAQP